MAAQILRAPNPTEVWLPPDAGTLLASLAPAARGLASTRLLKAFPKQNSYVPRKFLGLS